jgi:uncharacterized protein with ATP-grasp and redox domains
MIADLEEGEIPARIATRLQALVREALRTDDPFGGVKRRELERFGEASRRAQDAVAAAPDPLAAAVGMAVLGNIMDSGIIDRERMEEESARIAEKARAVRVPPAVLERILRSRRIGVLLDNAGEAAYDVPLLGRLARDGRDVWIGVKGGAVIDDLTEEEGRRIGLDRYGELVSNGNRSVGTDLDLCAGPFRARMDASDLILSKGQANFETLVGKVPNAVFLLRCKCPVVSRALGTPEGEAVILDGTAVS